MRRHVLRFLLLVLAVVVVVAIAGGGYLRVVLGRSLPVADGTLTLPGLGQPVTVSRDALGVPTIRAQSRVDLARATGFVHAQERFFQMDLQRRQPAGELSALVGAAALNADRTMRAHRFRAIAREALTFSPPDYRAQLEAYAGGVNAGLAAMHAPPFEYLVLRATPEPWTPEDSMLTAIAMFVTLQGAQWEYEDTLGVLHELPASMFEFLAGRASDWESPIVGDPYPVPPIPGPEEFEIRSGTLHLGPMSPGVPGKTSSRRPDPRPGEALPWWARLPHGEEATLGSNNWAVSGARSRSGSAIVANDMHLRLSVPNIWFRAAFEYPDDRVPGQTRRLVGVTLPGGPQMAVGSNGDIAWGFTNSVGDWSDVVIVEPVPGDPTKYQTPDGPRAFDVHGESIAVKGAAPVTLDARWTIWGPVVARDHHDRELALKWVAHDPRVLATDAARIADARSVDEAMRVSVGAALAAENLVVGDREGHIAWTIYGAVPRRVGVAAPGTTDGGWGGVPTSWADGSHRWDGYLDFDEHPRVVDPPDGRVWSANARVVGGEMLHRIGDGGYSDGIRAWMIREDLQRLDTADERALFDIQLDNRSIFLNRWRGVLPGGAHARGRAGLAGARGGPPAGRWRVARSRGGRVGGLPAGAQLPAHGVADGVRRVDRRREDRGARLRLRDRPPDRRSALASGQRTASPSARPGLSDLGRVPAGRRRPDDRGDDLGRARPERADVGRGQRRRHRASAGRSRAVAGAVPVDAARRAARRHLRAAGAHAAHRSITTPGGVAWS